MIAVTSSLNASGKSVIAANLAFEIAKTKSVCLVDLDFFAPSQHLYFGINHAPASLSAICRLIEQDRLTEADYDNLVLNLVVPNARVALVAGVASYTSKELISESSFETFIEMLALKYDEVIFDFSTITSSITVLEQLVFDRCESVVVTCLADPISVHRFVARLENLSQFVNFEKTRLVLNRVRESVLGAGPQRQLTETFRKHTPLVPKDFIPEDLHFDGALRQSVPLRFASKRAASLDAFERLIENLV